jgi:hypothetical protein
LTREHFCIDGVGHLALNGVSGGGLPWFDVTAYGASAGASDNTIAFQTAITACVGAGGGTVYVPPTSPIAWYVVKGPLTFAEPAGWCVLRLDGEIAVVDATGTGNKISLPRRWAVVGELNQAGGHGLFSGKPLAFIRTNGVTGPDPTIEITSGPVYLANLKVGDVKGDGILVNTTTGSHVTLDNVTVSAYGNGSGSPLRIKNSLWMYVSDSSFGVNPGTRTSPSIYIGDATTTTGLLRIENTGLSRRGIRIKASPTGSTSDYTFVNVSYEDCETALLEVDTTSGGVKRINIVDSLMADAPIAYLPLIEHVAGNLPVQDVYVRSTDAGGGNAGGIYREDTATVRLKGLVVDGQFASSYDVEFLGRQVGGGDPNGFAFMGGGLGVVGAYIIAATPGGTNVAQNGAVMVTLATPNNPAATGYTSGGTLAAGTYYYVLTALNGVNEPIYGVPYESWQSKQVSGTVASGTTGRVDLTWDAVPGAVSYRIYGRGQYLSGKNKYFTSSVANYSDTGTAGTSGAIPTVTRIYGNAPVTRFPSVGDNWIGQGNLGLGTYAPGEKLDVIGNIRASGQLISVGITFAALGTPDNGVWIYCSDCTIANPCAGAGTGAIAKRLNGVWVCN